MSDVNTPVRDDAGNRGAFATGEVVAGRFRILRQIGTGGMGAVYEAIDTSLDDEVVVLKTMLAKVHGNERLERRFRREARFARSIAHPNVCRTYDIGFHHVTLADGTRRQVLFVAMQFVKGETLGAYLTRKGRLDVTVALPLVRQMAAGLDEIHRQQIVHRDFKASNVMLVEEPDGLRAIIMDFGIARLVGYDAEDSATEQKLTATGQIIGSPDTIAPEQISAGPVAFYTDIYAFGIVMYQMLTGHLPFIADSPRALIMKRLTAKPITPETYLPSLAGAWSEFLLKCLALEPVERFQSIGELLHALPSRRPFLSRAPRIQNPSTVHRPAPHIKFEPTPQGFVVETHGVAELTKLFDVGFKAIIVCGEPNTGKSELVRGFSRAVDRFRGGGQLPSDSVPVGGTPPGAVWYQVASGHRKRVFIDPSGEFFSRLMPRQRERFGLPDVTQRDFDFIRRSVQQLAAIILVFDLTRRRDDMEAPWRDQENDFRFLLPALRWLRSEPVRQQPETGLTDAIRARSVSLPRIDVPILVAFTKADLLDTYTNVVPLEFARHRLPVLHGALVANARRFRYDFCHTMMRTPIADVPVESPCGVLLSFEWLLDRPFAWIPRLPLNRAGS